MSNLLCTQNANLTPDEIPWDARLMGHHFINAVEQFLERFCFHAPARNADVEIVPLPRA